jgi:predicted transcriptional regulator
MLIFYILSLLIYLVSYMTSKYIHRYRNRIDIIAQLLDAATSPTTKTKMMYRAMLSYEQLKEYLVMLTDNELIAYDTPSRRFTTTDKGYQFMKRYEDLNRLIGPIATIVAEEEDISIPS